MPDVVECQSQTSYAEKPVALTWQGQRLEILKIISGWRTPQEKHFRVFTSDEQTFELVYLETSDNWLILPL
ncbi:MAG: hypothetical protein JXA13_10340 [Anaerolineales bacterium]|nr:hypothetical protein [Anaerolineales bacterium]